MQCVEQRTQVPMKRAIRMIKNYYGMRNMVWSESQSRGDFICATRARFRFARVRSNFSRRFNEPDSDTRPGRRGKGCLRSEELLSNCCPAKPLLTKPPIKHYRGYQEAVDHFHGFARATLIQNALILRSYILAWYVLMHEIMHAIAN